MQALLSRDVDPLLVTPLLDSKQVGPSSIDLRLGTEFLHESRHAAELIDPFAQETLVGRESRVTVPFGKRYILHPGEFVLGATFEFVRLPRDVAGQVLGRSSWGRLGLLVATAVVVQSGFKGCLTLELVNEGNVPLALRPGLRIAQLCLWQSAHSVSVGYADEAAKYDAPLGPESAKLGVEENELKRLNRLTEVMTGVPTLNENADPRVPAIA